METAQYDSEHFFSLPQHKIKTPFRRASAERVQEKTPRARRFPSPNFDRTPKPGSLRAARLLTENPAQKSIAAPLSILYGSIIPHRAKKRKKYRAFFDFAFTRRPERAILAEITSRKTSGRLPPRFVELCGRLRQRKDESTWISPSTLRTPALKRSV